MDDISMKGIGIWLLAVVEAIMVFLAYLVGHFINHIPAELAVFIASILGSSQVLVFLIIKNYFKITEEDIKQE